MALILITGGIHDGPYTAALLRAPDEHPYDYRPVALTAHAAAFQAVHPDGEAEQFVDWLVSNHGYQRVPYIEAWLPPASDRSGPRPYAFEAEERA